MILSAKHLVTGDGSTCMEDAALYVGEDGRIGWIGSREEAAVRYPEEEVKDYGDATILPGLFDMHVHFGYYYSQPDIGNYDDYMVAYYALQQASYALELGITTVRDLSSPHNLLKQLRLAGQKGYVKVPRIFHSDAGICMTGGHGHEDGIEEVDGPWALRKEIRRQCRDGADWVKILTSNREDIPEFTQEELDAAIDESHRRGYKAAVHAGTQPSIQMCIDAGFDTIEHGTFMTVEQGRQMAEKGLAWVPTITAYTYLYQQTKKLIEEGGDLSNPIAARAVKDQAFFKPAYESYRDNFKAIYDTGVKVLAGSDMVLYGAPPLPIHQELAYMVEYGITPLEAIRTATVNPAEVLGIEHETGCLKEGLQGDILVVKGNAAKDIAALNQVAEVFMGGKTVYRPE